MTTATAPAPKVTAAATPKKLTAPVDTSFEKIAKAGKPETVKVKDVHVFRKLQARDDTDSGSVVDEGRCQQFAAAMEKGAKFTAIKVIKVTDAPGHAKEEVLVCWDGMHTLRAKEIAKQTDVDVLVWTGTFAQAQFLAATRANREHEANGKPLSSRDKIHAVKILAAAYKDADIPKSQWPSNRVAADIVGCSRQLVNDMDPFDRSPKGDVREVKAAVKRAERNGVAAAATANGTPPGGAKAPHFEIVQKSTGQVVASYDAKTETEALEIHKGHHKEVDQKTVIARQAKAAPVEPKPGSEKPVGFDWVGMDSHLGYLIRGLEGAGDLFGLKVSQEFKECVGALNTFATHLKSFRQKHGKKAS